MMYLLNGEKAVMLPSTRKLRVGLALSPELTSESDKYAVPLGVSVCCPACMMYLLNGEKAVMLPSTRKLKVGLALSPELISESDKYAVPLGVSRSVFFEEAMWIYLNHLDRYVNSEVKTQTQNEEALAA
jgi:hypothetical protein